MTQYDTHSEAAMRALDDFEQYLLNGLANARNGGERHLHEDALHMLHAYRGDAA